MKLVWYYSTDGTVVYVKGIVQTRFTKRWKLRPVVCFYTDRHEDVVAVAEDFIKRYEESIK